MRPFLVASLAAYLATIAIALIYRQRFFAIFVGVILGIHTFSTTLLEPSLAGYGLPVELGVWYAQLATFYYFFRLGRVNAPSHWYRALVSWPASWFAASAFLALPWSITAALGFQPALPWIPYAVGAFGFLQSSCTRREKRKILLDHQDAGPLARYEHRIRKLVKTLSA